MLARACCALALLAALPAAAQGPLACVTVRNDANGWYPVEIGTRGVTPATHRVDEASSREFCVRGPLAPDQFIEVKVKSWMNPVGVCRLKGGGQVHIVRLKRGGEETTEVRCQ